MSTQPSSGIANQSSLAAVPNAESTYEQVQTKNREYWDNQARKGGQAATCRSDWIASSTLRYLNKTAIDSQRILEVGCGDGNLIGNLNIAGERVGLDQSPVMLEQARKRFGETMTFIEGDATKLPFENDEFDFTYSSRCLINIQEPAMQFQGIRELIRVTKPGGTIILAENFTEGWEQLRKLRSRPWQVPLGGVGIQKQMDIDQVLSLLTQENCRLVRWHQYRLTNLFYHGFLIGLFRLRGIGVAERLFRPVLDKLTDLDTRREGRRPLLGKDTTLHFVVAPD
jgi:ubiquinone/menaquinone biosynthesis C-methylase UbiE